MLRVPLKINQEFQQAQAGFPIDTLTLLSESEILIGSLIAWERQLEYRLENPHKATLFSQQVIKKIFHSHLELVLLYMLVMKILSKLFPTTVIWNLKLDK